MLELKDWSYSRYSTWKKCPALLRYQMEDENRPAIHPAAERGIRIHKEIELYLRNECELPSHLSYYFQFLSNLKYMKGAPELKIALLHNWTQCAWEAEERWWRGILDCVVEGPEATYIYDWKTGKEYPDHRDQREVYAGAFAPIAPVFPIKVYMVYLDTRQNTFTTFNDTDIPAIQKKWTDKADEMINDKAFLPNPGYQCRSCHYSRDNGGPCRF